MRRVRGVRAFAIGFGLSGLLALVWGFGIEPGRLVVEESEVALPGCPPALDGLRIAILTDLHVGSPHNGLDRLDDVVEATARARPDLIVLLGDLVIHGVLGGRFVAPEASAAKLGRLEAPLGVVSVLGNHDWWLDGRRVERALESHGIAVLENESLPLRRLGQRFHLAGLADLWTRRVDFDAAFSEVEESEPVIVLTHNPDVFPDVPARTAITLAGHTHGGQVWLPLVGRPVVPSKFGQRYAAGFIEENGRLMFVSSGVGMSILPVRFLVPPEVSIVTLRRGYR